MATNPSNPTAPNDGTSQAPDAQTAADLIRDKISRVYAEEPDAAVEMAEAEQLPKRSKHQQFMYELSTSGKDLATVQTEWHNYYQSLPSKAQHEVWQEFYASQSMVTGQVQPASLVPDPQTVSKHKAQASQSPKTKKTANKPKGPKLRDARSSQDVQTAIRDKVSAGGKLQAKHHVQSLLFGLGLGLVVVIIFLFGFFNEVVIAPFIQPSRTAASTPLIVNSSSVAAKATPEVIIPKINVEIPTDFSQTSTNEAAIEAGLENGVVHYPTTSKPGENGNAAFFGHSSNNIFNKGKYKFAFVLLHTLVPGDTFYLTYNSKLYAYKVITRKIVEPTQVDVLDPVPGQTATATLITCDPPGTSLHRLVVVGEQISPDPSTNADASGTSLASSGDSSGTVSLPGNGPTLWGRYIKTTAGKAILVVLLLAVLIAIARWVNKPRRQLRQK
jgi:LPXTG-site transpeptidase (sortase) family protein